MADGPILLAENPTSTGRTGKLDYCFLSGNICWRKGLPRFSLCAAEQEYLLDDPLKVSRAETCKTTKSIDANKVDFSYFTSL